jgi:hypothetical protein
MANLLLQEFAPQEWGGLTSKNHLGAAYMLEPQKASDMVTMIFQANNSFADLTEYLKTIAKPLYLQTDDAFVWDLMAGGEKNIPLVEARIDGTAISATSKAGLGYSEFELVFAEPYFFDVNIIEGHKHEYQVRIIADPTPEGTNWVYRCNLVTGDDALFVPYEELVAGKKFSKLYSGVEATMSKKGGRVNYQSPFKMKNYFSRLRMEDTVPGNMISRPTGVAFSVRDSRTGEVKQTKLWQDYRDWEFDRQFRMERANLLYYSRLNRADDGTFKNKGLSGYEYEQGAGIRQQIESANVAYYPTENFSIDWLVSIMLDLSINKLPQDQRKFVLRTGERGMVQFSAALEDKTQLFTNLLVTDRVTGGTGNLTFGGQFLRYMGPQGIEITVQHDPMKDDPVVNKILHPNGGVAESYVYDLLDVGTVNSEPNIRLVYQTGMEDIRGYEAGLRDPFNPHGNGQMNRMSISTDGYKHHRMFIGGAMVKDPTRCIIIKPQILA